jgi:hypothetical protein
VGVVRRWRWTFWLILVAFLFGVLRVPAAVLQFTGIRVRDHVVVPASVVVLDTWADTVDGSRLNRPVPDMSPVSPVQDHLLPYLTWRRRLVRGRGRVRGR